MKPQASRPNPLFALAVLVTAMALTACNNLPGRPGDDPVLRPEELVDFNTLYSENCSGCHGTEGKGGAAVSLGDPVYQALVDDATLHRIITNGLPGTLMPGWGQSAGGTLTDQQINVLVHGMRAHWANPSALNGELSSGCLAPREQY
jgi:cytochrome c oxidase cbb3-type subunit 3/ubiquinol-cytochrome c reductase cytochrome c subunit